MVKKLEQEDSNVTLDPKRGDPSGSKVNQFKGALSSKDMTDDKKKSSIN